MSGVLHPSPESQPSAATSDRLGSWKEIAAYLGRDVRTVQRWEQTQGLPVHRHRHSRLSTAYAFKSELDDWWHNQSSSKTHVDSLSDAVSSDEDSRREPDQSPLPPAGSFTGWFSAIGVTVAAVSALAAAWYVWGVRAPGSAAVPFEARDFVLIAAFENRTGEALFDGTVEYALARELSNSTFVNVVPPPRIHDTLELMRKPADTRLDAAVAREVALRDGKIRVLIAGRAERFGTRYVLTADILRAADGAVTASVSEDAAAETELLPAIQRLAMQTRVRLGESLTQAPTASELPRVATSSFRALQLYARAREAVGWNESVPVNRPAAEQLLRQAIALDPAFAQAHMALATVRNAGPVEDRVALLPDVDRAVAAAQRSPEAERLLIEAEAEMFKATVSADGVARRQANERAAAALDAILHVQPDHFVAVARLMNATLAIGDRTRARNLSARYAELRPTSGAAQVTAARRAVEHGDAATARHYVARARALAVPLTHLPPHLAIWLALFDATEAWLAGDVRQALTHARAMSAKADAMPVAFRQEAARHLFFTYLSLGLLGYADRIVDDFPLDLEPMTREQQRGRVIALRGDRRALSAFFNKHFPTPEKARYIASALMDAGNLELARRVLAYHRQQRNLEGYDWYAGQLALLEGRPDEAIPLLEAAARFFPPMNNQGLKIARQLADAHHASGRLDYAVQLLEQATGLRGELAHGWEWLRARDRLAALYRETGRISDAENVDRELSALLVVADEDHGIKRRLAAAGHSAR